MNSKRDSQCGRACSVRCGTGRLLALRCMSLLAGGSMFRPGSGRRTGHWTEALTSDCPPRCRCTSGFDRQKCRSCASLSPCTSAGRAGSWSLIHSRRRLSSSYVSEIHRVKLPGDRTPTSALHQLTCPRWVVSRCWRQCRSGRSRSSETCCSSRWSPGSGPVCRSDAAGSRCTSCGRSERSDHSDWLTGDRCSQLISWAITSDVLLSCLLSCLSFLTSFSVSLEMHAHWFSWTL